MKRRLVIECGVALALAVPGLLGAQRGSAVLGFNALIQTPVGAFVPAAAATRLPFRRNLMGAHIIYGKWQNARSHAEHTNFGFGWTFLHGPVRTTIQAAHQHTLDCRDCHGLLGGIDVNVALFERVSSNESAIVLSVNPAAGFGHALGWDNWTAHAAGVSLPIAAKLPVGSNLFLIPFVSPGAGFGRYSGSGESRVTSQTMLAGGVVLNVRSFPLKLTGGVRTFFTKREARVWGFGISTLD